MEYCKNLVSFWDEHLYKHFSSDKKYQYRILCNNVETCEKKLKYAKDKLVKFVKEEQHEIYLKEVNYKEN